MRLRTLALVAALLLASQPAKAAPITIPVPPLGDFVVEAVIGGSLFVEFDGDVVATFLGSGAAFDSELYLESPANALGMLFQNHTSPPLSTVNLGAFTAGTELVFKLLVTTTGDSFFSGPAGANPDGVAHVAVANADDAPGLVALVSAFTGGAVNLAGQTVVGFEDIFGGGDNDYNDLVFAFSNLGAEPPSTSVPEPTSLALFGTGLAGIVAARRRRSR